MRRIIPLLSAVSIAALAAGCASRSGYNVDIRNITSETVLVELKATEKDKEPQILASKQYVGGSHSTIFSEAPARAKVTLEARLAGQPDRPAAVMPLGLGTSAVDLIPPLPRHASDPNAPAIRIRERAGY